MIESRHLDTEALSALVEDEYAGEQPPVAAAHVRSCPQCAERLAGLRALVAEARALPASIEPPDDLWDDVRRAIDAVPSADGAAVRPMVGSYSLVRSRWMLAAAAAVLVVASSWVTAVVVRRDASRELAADVPVRAAADVNAPAVLPAALATVEAGYRHTAGELERALADQRTHLAPRTIATIEQSLRTIDEAIAEARRALATDPRNSGLIDIFTANYEQKLDLLRRAAELPASS
jgi:hypothetical protein